jgi:Tfp pilus assembly protein PilV
MKIKNLAFIALISMIICGIGVLGFLEIRNKPVIPRHSQQHQIPEPDSDRSALISKSTTLLLLAVGVIGALSVRRKKKNKRSPAQKNKPQTTSDDRNKAFVKLNKQYLNLQYKITQHKFTDENPPDCLLKEISDLERKVRLISRALE